MTAYYKVIVFKLIYYNNIFKIKTQIKIIKQNKNKNKTNLIWNLPLINNKLCTNNQNKNLF